MILTDEELHAADPCPHSMFDQQRLDYGRAVERLLLRKLRERPADAWLVRRLDAPLYPVMFMHKPVDALSDPERSVQGLHIIPEVNE